MREFFKCIACKKLMLESDIKIRVNKNGFIESRNDYCSVACFDTDYSWDYKATDKVIADVLVLRIDEKKETSK